ncbi:hypothetical protein KKF84_00540 [Myxococcota bacterium]|nr:hypothetical protein [Myxococcota bacterium]MBU1533772.1 hypothetical protein [Myxococcota bacterium]
MTKQIRKFFAMVQVELEDLVEDVNHSIQLAGYKHKMDTISERVYKQNLVVYHSELAAFDTFGKIVNVAKRKKFNSMVEVNNYLKDQFRQAIKSSGYVERAMYFMDRKFKKIGMYMEQMDD